MTLDHAHILDTAHVERFPLRKIPLQQRLAGSVMKQSRRVRRESTRQITRAWSPATPGQIRELKAHHEATLSGAFEITLQTGEVITAIYRRGPKISQKPSGFGTAIVELEQVMTWD